jgi:hypothetical protein
VALEVMIRLLFVVTAGFFLYRGVLGLIIWSVLRNRQSEIKLLDKQSKEVSQSPKRKSHPKKARKTQDIPRLPPK